LAQTLGRARLYVTLIVGSISLEQRRFHVKGKSPPMRKLPPLNAVRAFDAAARYVSFTKAADELCVTHGAISRQVALLEDWFGRPLFHRAASQLTLTDAGRSFHAEASAALDRIAVASMYLIEQAAPTALRISAPPTFTMRWLIARLSRFQRRRPEVELRISTSIAPVVLKDNLHDLSIRGAVSAPTDCSSICFMTETILAVCHPDLTESGGLKTPDDLSDHVLLSYATEPYRWSQWMAATNNEDLKSKGSLKFEQMYFALQAASEGLGVVLVPLFLVVDDILEGRLCAPFGLEGASARNYYACYSESSEAYPLVRNFVEWLQAEGRDTEASMKEWGQAAGWSSVPKT
jgi:LysR family transcriptional regulator, glycine cleavage system transcriptional activator